MRLDNLGDISTLADPSVVEDIIIIGLINNFTDPSQKETAHLFLRWVVAKLNLHDRRGRSPVDGIHPIPGDIDSRNLTNSIK